MLADFCLEWNQDWAPLRTDSEIWFNPAREDGWGRRRFKRPKLSPECSERGQLRIKSWKPKWVYKVMEPLVFQENQEGQLKGCCIFDQAESQRAGFVRQVIDKAYFDHESGEQGTECVDFGVRQKLLELHNLGKPQFPHL